MTERFAFPASQALAEDFEAVIQAFAHGIPREPQSARVVALAQRYADEIVDALILALVRGSAPDSHAPGVLDKVASLIKGTVHALIRQVVGKLSNKELASVADYVRHRRSRIEVDGVLRDHISFDLEPQDAFFLRSTWGKAAQGEGDLAEMTRAMTLFGELAIDAFYVDSAKALSMGFIARNMFNVGHVAISKGAKTAISHLVPNMKARELQYFGAYFLGMLKTSS